jgi:hypothetical protein
MALFNCWNENHFAGTIGIFRSELMARAKIGSKNTYAKCLRDLHAWNYITYMPSRTLMQCSMVSLTRFDITPADDAVPGSNANPTGTSRGEDNLVKTGTGDDPVMPGAGTETGTTPAQSGTSADHTGTKTGTTGEPQVVPLNKTLLNTSNVKTSIINTPAKKIEIDSAETRAPANRKEKKLRAGAMPPSFDEVQAYFLARQSTVRKAQRFFNHYTSNGWKVGPNAMTNWKASAENCIDTWPDPPENKPISKIEIDNTNSKEKKYDTPL